MSHRSRLVCKIIHSFLWEVGINIDVFSSTLTKFYVGLNEVNVLWKWEFCLYSIFCINLSCGTFMYIMGCPLWGNMKFSRHVMLEAWNVGGINLWSQRYVCVSLNGISRVKDTFKIAQQYAKAWFRSLCKSFDVQLCCWPRHTNWIQLEKILKHYTGNWIKIGLFIISSVLTSRIRFDCNSSCVTSQFCIH